MKASVLLILALVSVALGFHTHEIFGDTSVFPLVKYEDWYRWAGVYPWRSSFFALASLLLVAAVWQLRSRGAAGAAPIDSQILASRAWGLVTWSIAEDGADEPRPVLSITVKELVLWVVVGLALLFLAIFLFRPTKFIDLSHDDGPVETASALLLFVSCGIFFFGACRTLHPAPWSNRVFRVTSALIALFLFFAGMEEISWGQRVFKFDTPRSFEANEQGEFNLHNFDAPFFNACYYMLSFVLFVLLPFLKDRLEALRRVEILSFFVPSCFVLFASVIGVAYTWARWSEFMFQMSFFTTLFILISYAWHLRSNDRTFLLPALVTVYLLTQILLVVHGINPDYHWQINEYKEFFIPLSFLFYSLEMLQKFRRRRSLSDRTPISATARLREEGYEGS
jgi:hypothetical protein